MNIHEVDSQMVKLIWIPVLKMVLNEFGHVKCLVRSNCGIRYDNDNV